MKGKSFAFVDKATTAGYLLPLAYFQANGIERYEDFLGETYFTGTHEDAIYDVLNKKVDIAAAKNTVFTRLAADDGRIKNELVVLERSPDVPENALAVRKDLAHSLKHELRKALLDMQKDSNGMTVLQTFGASRFIETTDDNYVNVYRYAQEIQLNLGTYHYRNY